MAPRTRSTYGDIEIWVTGKWNSADLGNCTFPSPSRSPGPMTPLLCAKGQTKCFDISFKEMNKKAGRVGHTGKDRLVSVPWIELPAEHAGIDHVPLGFIQFYVDCLKIATDVSTMNIFVLIIIKGISEVPKGPWDQERPSEDN